MKLLEDRLSATLMRCREAIALAQHQAAEPLHVAQSGCDFTLYVSGGLAAHRVRCAEQRRLAPQLGRSLLSLITEQSQRLQHQANELATLRATLEERNCSTSQNRLMQQHG